MGSTGLGSFLAIGTGLAVNLSAVPLNLTWANGFNNVTGQPVDFYVSVSATVTGAWSGLTASSTCYLYVDYNSGTPSYGFSVLAPLYQPTAPGSPATGQHWFDTTVFLMKSWSGSAWTTVYRVFVGVAVTGASTVTSVTAFPPKNRTHVIARRAANMAVTANVGFLVPFDTRTRDELYELDITNGRVNIKRSGWYLVTGAMYLSSVPSGTNVVLASITVNGSEVARAAQIATTVNAVYSEACSATLYLNAGDYVNLGGWSSANCTLNSTDIGAYTNQLIVVGLDNL
jgi:hypothetical protein